MRPITFNGWNKNLTKPEGWTDEECNTLPVFSDGQMCVSKWRMTWRERFHCLFKGFVWLTVHNGESQPPVLLEAKERVLSVGDVNWEKD